jgi:broad specificity phosphatase PhoE
MKRASRVLLAFVMVEAAFAAVSSSHAQTVVFLVRHAEKVDESDNSPLSDAGRARAKALAAMLKDSGIQVVYSTDYSRTLETAKPVAEAVVKLIEVYDGDHQDALAAELREKGRGALVVGHRDTIPELVKLLGGDPGPPIPPEEYDRMYVLMLFKTGKSPTTILRYPSGAVK